MVLAGRLPCGQQLANLPCPFPPLQGAFRRSRNRSQGAELAQRNPLFTPRPPLMEQLIIQLNAG